MLHFNLAPENLQNFVNSLVSLQRKCLVGCVIVSMLGGVCQTAQQVAHQLVNVSSNRTHADTHRQTDRHAGRLGVYLGVGRQHDHRDLCLLSHCTLQVHTVHSRHAVDTRCRSSRMLDRSPCTCFHDTRMLHRHNSSLLQLHSSPTRDYIDCNLIVV